MKRVAIVGTRPPDPRRPDSCPADAWSLIEADVIRTLDGAVRKHGHIVIVTGGAEGVDTIAETYAMRNRLSRIVHEPNYRDEGVNKRAAPVIRNQLIVDDCDVMLAWPKPSRTGGTEDAIRRMMKKDAANCFVREPWKVAKR